MRTPKIILLLLLILNGILALAQSDTSKIIYTPRTRIGFNIGPHLGYMKDLNYAVLNYRENGTAYSLQYMHDSRTQKYQFNGEINFTSGDLKTKASTFFKTPFIQGNISLSFLFKVRQLSNSNIRVYAGPQLNSFFQYMQWGEDMDSWNYLMVHGLNLTLSGHYKLSEHKSIVTTLSVPVFSNLVRPPYNGFNEYIVQNQDDILKLAFKGEPASLNKYVNIDCKFIYHYALGAHADFTAGYLFRYQHVSGYNELNQFQNQFFAGLTFKF
jgi:hypothetical protein